MNSRPPRLAIIALLPRIAWSLARFATALTLLAFAIALAMGRSVRQPPPPGDGRNADLVRLGDPLGGADLFLDARDARPVDIASPPGNIVERASWSPAAPGREASEVVGLLRPTPRPPGGEICLARIAQPGGEVLDRISIGALPNWWGAPCWFPDGSERILLAGGDNALHRVDFDRDGASEARSSLLPWKARLSGVTPTKIDDLSWPAGPGLGGRLVAALDTWKSAKGDHPAGTWTAWWIQLGESQSEIIDAGPLVRRAGSATGRVDERYPVLSPAEAGPPTLAWLEGDASRYEGAWRLKAGPVEIDPETGAPYVREERSRVLAEDCARVGPVFGNDGSWIAYVPAGPHPSPRVRRISLAPSP